LGFSKTQKKERFFIILAVDFLSLTAALTAKEATTF
jgi:hypothetical protein